MSTSHQPAPGSWRNLTEVNNARSFVLMGSGVLIGLMLAGYSLFTAHSATILFVPAEDVALVNQQPVSRSDYLAFLQTLYGVDLAHASAQQRRKVLEDMIREELFVQRGKELDVAATDPDVRSALVNAVELEIAENAITSSPSEAALRQFYQTHRDRYVSEGMMQVEDVVFATAAEAESRRNGRDSGKTKGEEFYFAAKIHLGDTLFASARELADGAFSAPIAMSDGVHVLEMHSNKRPMPFDFPAARAQVLSDYRNQAIDRLKANGEAFLRKRANVLIADDLR